MDFERKLLIEALAEVLQGDQDKKREVKYKVNFQDSNRIFKDAEVSEKERVEGNTMYTNG